MYDFLTILTKNSISMSILVLVYMAVTTLFSKPYVAKWRYYSWMIVVLGFIIPFRPHFEIPLLQVDSVTIPSTVKQIIQVNIVGDVAQTEMISHSVSIVPWYWWIGVLWIIGVVGFIVYNIIRHRRFIGMVKRWSEEITEPTILTVLNHLEEELKISNEAKLKVCPCITSPMMIGFINPVILLPSKNYSPVELSFILKHELVHFKRKDLWYKGLVFLATAIHWFNPVIYLMAKEISVQCEISCDAEVVKGTDMDKRQQYSETIIGVIKNQSRMQTAFSSNFYGGKKGMKNRISSIMDTKKKKVGITIICLVMIGVIMTGATLSATAKTSNDVSDEYNKLLDLRFDGYENMTVNEYRDRAWNVIGQDEVAYFELLDNIPESWYDVQQTNKDINFILDILTPTIAEKWKTRDFDGYTTWDTGVIEYGASYTILDANTLTMGERNRAIKSIKADVSRFVEGKSKSELADEIAMQTLLESEGQKWGQKYSSPSLNIVFSFLSFRSEPISQQEAIQGSSNPDNTENVQENPTPEDFALLLSLKTAGHENLSVADFNKAVLVTMVDDGEYHDASERVYSSIRYGTDPGKLSQKELNFLNITLNASIAENAAKHMQQYTDEVMRPYLSDSINRELTKPMPRNNTEMLVFQATAEYILYYDVLDENNLTVAERDHALTGLINGIRTFINSKSEDELVGGEAVFEAEIHRLGKQYSNDHIQLSAEKLFYQVHDERDVEAFTKK